MNKEVPMVMMMLGAHHVTPYLTPHISHPIFPSQVPMVMMMMSNMCTASRLDLDATARPPSACLSVH